MFKAIQLYIEEENTISAKVHIDKREKCIECALWEKFEERGNFDVYAINVNKG